jgi:hypothetical protein
MRRMNSLLVLPGSTNKVGLSPRSPRSPRFAVRSPRGTPTKQATFKRTPSNPGTSPTRKLSGGKSIPTPTPASTIYASPPKQQVIMPTKKVPEKIQRTPVKRSDTNVPSAKTKLDRQKYLHSKMISSEWRY